MVRWAHTVKGLSVAPRPLTGRGRPVHSTQTNRSEQGLRMLSRAFHNHPCSFVTKMERVYCALIGKSDNTELKEQELFVAPKPRLRSEQR